MTQDMTTDTNTTDTTTGLIEAARGLCRALEDVGINCAHVRAFYDDTIAAIAAHEAAPPQPEHHRLREVLREMDAGRFSEAHALMRRAMGE